MAKLDGHEIPAGVLDELKQMLDGAPDKAIMRYAQGIPELARGFRPGSKRSVAPVRRRLARTLDADHEIDPLLITMMAAGGLAAEFSEFLSDLALADSLPAFAALYGRDRLLAALLVDPRAEVRELATEVLDGEVELPELNTEDARAAIQKVFTPFIGNLLEWFDAPDEKQGEGAEVTVARSALDVKKELKQNRERIADLEKQLDQKDVRSKTDKSLRKKVESLNQQLQKREADLRAAQQELEKERRAGVETKTELRKVREAHAALGEAMKDDVARQVEAELSSVRQRWLRRPLKMENEAEAIRQGRGDADLIARAEKLLKKQVELDRHSGNLAVVKERLADIQTALVKVRTARRDALHPLSELEQIEADLESERRRLATLAGNAADPGGDFTQAVLAQINAAETEGALGKLKDVLDKLDELDVLSVPGMQVLYRGFHDRMARIYAAFTPNVVRKKRPSDPVWRLKTAVQDNRQLIVILDGHNVVHLLPNLFADTYTNGEPGKDTRKALVDRMMMIFKPAGECRVDIVFDGPSPSTRRHAKNVQEIYSGGGQAEHRADQAILEFLEYCCQSMSAMPRILVTDDRDLREAAVKLGAKFMPVAQFGAFLEEMEA